MPSTVEPGYGAYLQSPARYVSAGVAATASAYADKAIASTILSPIALQSDAFAEASRQVLFMSKPIARDRLVVKGRRRDLIGRLITANGNRLGYDASPSVFVIAAAESDDGGTTTLTVLKRL